MREPHRHRQRVGQIVVIFGAAGLNAHAPRGGDPGLKTFQLTQ